MTDIQCSNELQTHLVPSGDAPDTPVAPDIDAVVLAGVHTWGGCPLERVAPRPMVPIAGRPLIEHVIAWLCDSGIHSANICANSDTVEIWRRLGDGSDLDVRLQYYEDVTPRGPAGCVRDAVRHSSAETVLVVDGTIIPDVDVASLLKAHQASGAVLTVGVAGDPGIDFTAQDGLRPVGIYVVSRSALNCISATGYQDIKEGLIPALHKAGEKVLAFPVGEQAVARVFGVTSYLAVSKHVIEKVARQATTPVGYQRRGEALVHDSAAIDPTAQLIGPVLVEPGCVVEAGAIVVGPTSLGVGTRIEQRAVVSRSVIWADCGVGPSATVDNSVLTDGACIAPSSSVRGMVCVPPYPDAAGSRLRSFRLAASVLDSQHAPNVSPVVARAIPSITDRRSSRLASAAPRATRTSRVGSRSA